MRILLTLILAALCVCPIASPFAADEQAPRAVGEMLERIIPDHAPDSIRPAAIAGWYEVSYGADIFYVDEGGRYVMRGELYDMNTQANLTESRRAALRRSLVDALEPDDLVVFAPRDGARHVVHVFTDIDCNFCRRLHRDIARYNELGIEVRYLAFPRSGPDTPSYYKIVSVWCDDDRRDAMTRSKAGATLPRKDCENPVLAHLELASQFGVRGTPTFVLPDGTTLPGYVPADRLAEYLDGEFGD